jgi:hypothetical protein
VKLNVAIYEARDTVGYARPASWKGTGRAIAVRGGSLLLHEGKQVSPWQPQFDDVITKWEVLTEEAFMREQRK